MIQVIWNISLNILRFSTFQNFWSNNNGRNYTKLPLQNGCVIKDSEGKNIWYLQWKKTGREENRIKKTWWSIATSSKQALQVWTHKQSPFTTSNTETSIITSNVRQINLSNENIKYNSTLLHSFVIFPMRKIILIKYFNWHFVLKTFIWDIFQITEKKQRTKYQQFSDEHLTW